jgi:TANK-binding kinase 1
LEKIKIAETGKRIKALLNDDVKPAVALEAECLADWYKMAQTIFLQTQILQKDVTMNEESLFEMKDRLIRIKEDVKNDAEVCKATENETANGNKEAKQKNKDMLKYIKV